MKISINELKNLIAEVLLQEAKEKKDMVLKSAGKGIEKISIFPGSFKPFHRGHYKVVQLAAAQSSILYLFVSTKDRIRPGEFPIMGSAAIKMWKNYIEPILPNNVVVSYTGEPIQSTYEFLDKLDKKNPQNTKVFLIVGTEDIERFKPSKLDKYVPNLFSRKMIETVAVPRFDNFSGTGARVAISSQNKKQFKNILPEPLVNDADTLLKLFYKAGMEQMKSLKEVFKE